MANATITVLEADGTTETDVVVLDVGRQAAAASKSIATCTEDKAVLDAQAASLSVMDDWDESDRAKVNPIVGQAGIAAGAGAVGATVPRVTHASDDPAVTALQIMDDWDESDRAKANIIVGQAGVAAGAGAVGATVQRMTLASDDPAVAHLATLATADPAHDAADTGSPVKIGGKAVAALSGLTLVAAADRVNAAFDLDGALIVRNGGAIGDRVSAVATNTDGTSTACITAQGSGIKTNLTDVTIANTSASNITVDIKDGTTVKWTFPVPANSGVTHRFETPLTGTANTAWNFDPSAAATTITCSMAGRLSKI